MKVTNASYCLRQGLALAMEYADLVQIQVTQGSKWPLIDEVICVDCLELPVPAPSEYVNFNWKTEKKRDVKREDLDAKRSLNAPRTVASDRRTGEAK